MVLGTQSLTHSRQALSTEPHTQPLDVSSPTPLETGSRYISLDDLELTDIWLPLPPQSTTTAAIHSFRHLLLFFESGFLHAALAVLELTL